MGIPDFNNMATTRMRIQCVSVSHANSIRVTEARTGSAQKLAYKFVCMKLPNPTNRTHPFHIVKLKILKIVTF
jgi:hypothetical protein